MGIASLFMHGEDEMVLTVGLTKLYSQTVTGQSRSFSYMDIAVLPTCVCILPIYIKRD